MKHLNLLTAILVAAIVTSCSKDDDRPLPKEDTQEEVGGKENNVKIQITDSNAGSFLVTNLTTNEVLDGHNSYVLYYDSLRFEFLPNKKYSKFHFVEQYERIRYSKVEQIKPVYVCQSDDGTKLIMNASCRFESGDTIYNLSASRELTIQYPEHYSEITYIFGITKDLLTFVTPVVDYSDYEGHNNTIQLTDEMIHIEDDSVYEGINYGGFGKWTKDVRYLKWGIDCGMRVRFVAKPNVELSKDAYEFDQWLSVPSASSHGTNSSGTIVVKNYSWITINITINIGKEAKTDDGLIRKEYVQEYIEQLIRSPLQQRFHIDEDGEIVRLDEK